jgi:enterobacterial common antigen flippase
LKSNLSGAWLGTVVASGAILLSGLATGVLTARLLEPQGRGVLAAVLFWPHLITSLGLLSLPSAMIFRQGRPDARRRQRCSSWAGHAAGA